MGACDPGGACESTCSPLRPLSSLVQELNVFSLPPSLLPSFLPSFSLSRARPTARVQLPTPARVRPLGGPATPPALHVPRGMLVRPAKSVRVGMATSAVSTGCASAMVRRRVMRHAGVIPGGALTTAASSTASLGASMGRASGRIIASATPGFQGRRATSRYAPTGASTDAVRWVCRRGLRTCATVRRDGPMLIAPFRSVIRTVSTGRARCRTTVNV